MIIVVLSNGKRVKGKWYLKFIMVFVIVGMCGLGVFNEVCLMLLVNGNGDEIIWRNGDVFWSFDVFLLIERILWDKVKYKRFVCVSEY